MENLKIEQLLVEKNLELEHFNTPKLRADALLEFLENEYNNNRNIDLISSVRKEFLDMLDEINKFEILIEVDYSIKILVFYKQTGNFDLKILPLNAMSKDLSNKIETLKSLLSKIVIGN